MGAHQASVWRETQTLSGKSAGAVILEDIALGGGFNVLNAEMISVSEADYNWCLAELEGSGPLLGLDVMGEWCDSNSRCSPLSELNVIAIC